MSAYKAFRPEDIYPAVRKGYIQAGKLGALLTASEELLRAQLAGVEPDPTKVGAPGDIKIGAAAIADTLNRLCGHGASERLATQSGVAPQAVLRAEGEQHKITRAQIAEAKRQLAQLQGGAS